MKNKKDKKWETGSLKSFNELKRLTESLSLLSLNNKEEDISTKIQTQKLEEMKRNISFSNNFLRSVILIVDFSDTLTNSDNVFKPNKLEFLYQSIKEFASNFFVHNILSSLSVVGCMNYKAELIVPIQYDEEAFLKKLKEKWPYNSLGKFSLYNALIVSYKIKT